MISLDLQSGWAKKKQVGQCKMQRNLASTLHKQRDGWLSLQEAIIRAHLKCLVHLVRWGCDKISDTDVFMSFGTDPWLFFVQCPPRSWQLCSYGAQHGTVTWRGPAPAVESRYFWVVPNVAGVGPCSGPYATWIFPLSHLLQPPWAGQWNLTWYWRPITHSSSLGH